MLFFTNATIASVYMCLCQLYTSATIVVELKAMSINFNMTSSNKESQIFDKDILNVDLLQHININRGKTVIMRYYVDNNLPNAKTLDRKKLKNLSAPLSIS